ncbi:hypothetical protein [Polaromonas sp. CG_9.11]|uniref:hypothetical protein n=1 Tax=Polaromonas sp. CG_9.11 TaxID=2787730 RepID=UPI0018CB13E3|nr:hypothetical protein [Polaromonas sp. CG_9.11]MBG6076457.1 hypothetical protein [Polaromonas sp. CG_9.11]
MRPNLTPHLLIPFAACSAEAWLPTLQSLPPDGFKRLGQLLQGMKLVQTDTQVAESFSPPHERALARALGLATRDTADGLLPWAASKAMEELQAGLEKAWAWITPCHWAMGHLHATLSDPALLDLQEDESRRLLALMQPYFETDGITLHYLAPGRWLAEGELFRGLPTASMDRVLARNVDAWLPNTKNAAPLRRLQNEMQMLLYTHPSNDERAARRQLPVNSFWISGTGDLPSAELGEALTPDIFQREREKISVPRSLAEAVFREDWAGYAQAWATLEAGDMAALLARQQRGESVRLTLCGESSAQTFETQRAGLRTRISNFFSSLRPLDILKKL